MSNDCYIPEEDYIQPQSQTNNQGRDGELSDTWKSKYKTIIRDITNKAVVAYRSLVGEGSFGDPGLSRELSRIVLPVSNYTECYWKIDLHNFFHFCRLRMDSHAQQEIQDYAIAMFNLVKPHFPIATEAFEDYSLHSKSFSRIEMVVLQHVFAHFPLMQHSSGYVQNILSYIDELQKENSLGFNLSKREWTEFKEKLK
jgi:thymidylate synthase (FAD)